MKYVKQAVHYWCEETISKKYTGQGVCIAVLDSGIVPHPDINGRVRAFYDCVNRRNRPYDDNGHGTHVAGILAGNGSVSGGNYAGMAPKAGLVAVKVLDAKGEGSVDNILRGVQWILRNWKLYGICIVNISVGANLEIGDEKGKELEQAVEAMWDDGLIVVVSAGNYGPGEGTVSVPGTSRKIITVGSSEVTGAVIRKKTVYHSGCGPTKECVVKPEVAAPGHDIISLNYRFGKPGQSPYIKKSGTSMSTPVAAGALALLLSKYKDMTNVEVKLRLRECCDMIEGTTGCGWGRINVKKLLD